MSTDNKNPLILVFYLDRHMLQDSQIRDTFSKSVDHIFKSKKMNAIGFFLPTDGEDRIECINPVLLEKPDMDKINQMIDEISGQFGLKEKLDDVPDEDIVIENDLE